MNSKRRVLIAGIPLLPAFTACGSFGANRYDRHPSDLGLVVRYELAPGSAPKEGVEALSDSGYRLFGPAILDHRNPGTTGIGGGGKVSFPRWVRITWREGTTPGKYWTTGKVIGDYTVNVLGRLPDELFTLAKAGPRRAITLHFRLVDKGVQFGWSIQDGSRLGGYKHIYRGGDFEIDS